MSYQLQNTSRAVPAMGPPNSAPGGDVMGAPDSSRQLYLMAGADRRPGCDVFGGPDAGPRVDLMGHSAPEFVDSLFTGKTGERSDRRVTPRAAALAGAPA